jgi:hypothetical protein
MDQGRDIGDVLPWTRVVRSVAQALTGQTYDPEAVVKAPLEAARGQISPESQPDVSYQEYLVRKKLAEMSLTNTGQNWYDNPDYQMAMLDPSSDLWKEATRQSGVEQFIIGAARKATPLQLAYLPKAEATIRGAKAQNPSNMTTDEWVQSLETNPTAQGYRWLSTPVSQAVLQVKQNTYYNLPEGSSRELFVAQNPDLQTYLDWAKAERKAGRKPTIAGYVAK